MHSKTAVWIAFACLVLASGAIVAHGVAEKADSANPPAAAPSAEAPTYTKKGADTCLKCHDESSKFPVLSIFKTKHAQSADPRSPFAKLQCETCHGPAGITPRKCPRDRSRRRSAPSG
jgi:hypothetical protein